jgi:hypothetical protein
MQYQTQRTDLTEPKILFNSAQKRKTDFDNAAMQNYLSAQPYNHETSPGAQFKSPNFELSVSGVSGRRSANRTPLSIKEKALQNVALGRV